MSLAGAAQQISTEPRPGGSSGYWTYLTVPSTTPVTHVWHTPLRHAYRVGTSHASANSRKVWKPGDHSTLSPLRANVTGGPDPALRREGGAVCAVRRRRRRG